MPPPSPQLTHWAWIAYRFHFNNWNNNFCLLSPCLDWIFFKTILSIANNSLWRMLEVRRCLGITHVPFLHTHTRLEIEACGRGCYPQITVPLFTNNACSQFNFQYKSNTKIRDIILQHLPNPLDSSIFLKRALSTWAAGWNKGSWSENGNWATKGAMDKSSFGENKPQDWNEWRAAFL